MTAVDVVITVWGAIGSALFGWSIGRITFWRVEARRRTQDVLAATEQLDRLLETLQDTVAFVEKADCTCPQPKLPFMAKRFLCERCRILEDTQRRHDPSAPPVRA